MMKWIGMIAMGTAMFIMVGSVVWTIIYFIVTGRIVELALFLPFAYFGPIWLVRR